MLHHQDNTHHQVQTPVKDRRGIQPLTAQSEQEGSASFEDISAEQLFSQFSQLVRVSESEIDIQGEEEELERKLTYESLPSYKLEFEPKSSMLKSNLKKEAPSLQATALFKPQPLQEVKHCLLSQNDQCFTPVERAPKDHPQLHETPKKSMKQ